MISAISFLSPGRTLLALVTLPIAFLVSAFWRSQSRPLYLPPLVLVLLAVRYHPGNAFQLSPQPPCYSRPDPWRELRVAPFPTPTVRVRNFVLSMAITTTQTNGVGSMAQHDWMADVTIERVSTKRRALDVHVFRQWSISAKEHIEKQTQSSSTGSTEIMTEDEAIDHLMRGYGSDGRYINNVSKNDPAVQFVTLYQPQHSGSWKSGCYNRQNGVVGAVDIQLRNADSDVSIDDMVHLVERSQELSATGESDLSFSESSLPSHVYLSNLRVDDQMQGHGLGAALMAAVTFHVRTQTPASMILLTVQNDNHSAIRVYLREGYGYLEKNKVFGRMFKITTNE
jgi:ribosomal protein S18 acetylase RimI-like enzyme